MGTTAILLREFLLYFATVTVAALGGACAGDANVVVRQKESPTLGVCLVTQPGEPAFVPQPPHPAIPPRRDGFWFGTRSLWTVLPGDGVWGQLALGEKFWWWSEEFNIEEERTPEIVVTGRRLDGAAAPFRADEATHAYAPDLHQAMLVGVTLPTAGCWEFTAEYRSHRVVLVQWVPGP